MFTKRLLLALPLVLCSMVSHASGTLKEEDVKNVDKVDIATFAREQLAKVAGLLASYEIEANKLVAKLEDDNLDKATVDAKANELVKLSEEVIHTARFRLPQCDTYLSQALVLKDKLTTIPHEVLEKDYHADGALPQAPAECYHTKDIFVHPATVLVLTRDDPTLTQDTRDSINAEITEVVAHLEIVRQLVIY
jgi:hypothetical protein